MKVRIRKVETMYSLNEYDTCDVKYYVDKKYWYWPFWTTGFWDDFYNLASAKKRVIELLGDKTIINTVIENYK